MSAIPTGMYVIKRSGKKEEVHFDKITQRIKNLTTGLDTRYIDPVAVSMKVVQGIYSGVTTRELDQLAAETCERPGRCRRRAHTRRVVGRVRHSV